MFRREWPNNFPFKAQDLSSMPDIDQVLSFLVPVIPQVLPRKARVGTGSFEHQIPWLMSSRIPQSLRLENPPGPLRPTGA